MKREGYVYFIKASESKLIKIGKTTTTPVKRKKEIQSMSPVHLYTIGVLASGDCHKFEREMHDLFQPIRAHGEWFDFSDYNLGTLKRSIKTKKKSTRAREGKDLFDYKSFKEYWNRELRNTAWV